MLKHTEKSSVSIRIALRIWNRDEYFDGLMKLLEKYRGVTDEVTFFTVETHACLKLDRVLSNAPLLAKRINEVRKLGYKAGIDHLTTIGFFEENLLNILPAEYGQRTHTDGWQDKGGRCSNNPKMKEYIQQLYLGLAATNPDYIWLDDDIHSGMCFCEDCLHNFAKIAGRYYSREELADLLNKGDIESKLDIRKKWLEHSRQTIFELLELVERTVHGVNPEISLGLMTGDRFPEGYDFDKWVKILAGTNNVEVRWRPGEGFWSDEKMPDMLVKAHSIGRQVAFLPDDVKLVQTEIENFMYQPFKKSRTITSLEPAVYIATGSMGAAYNVFLASETDKELKEYEPLIARLHKARPFYDLLVKTLGHSKPQGIYTGWNRETVIAGNLAQGEWRMADIGKIAGCQTGDLFEIGLPAAYTFENSQVTLLVGDSVRSFSPEMLQKILSGGVYMDAAALRNLNEMGYGDLTGFDIDGQYDSDCIEQFVHHPLNGDFAGQTRDGRQSFIWMGWHIPATSLVPKYDSSQTLSKIIDYSDNVVATCGSGIFENRLGGRVCVAGYAPWIFLQYVSKSFQMKSIFKWLSKETLPAYIDSFHKINLWPRTTVDGRKAACLLNSSLDSAENVELMMKTDCNEIIVYDMDCNSSTINASATVGNYKKFVLPLINQWKMVLIYEK